MPRPSLVVLGAAVALAATFALAAEPPSEENERFFGLTAPIACKEIRGYEDYDVLPNARLTRDEKLQIYYRPLHFKTRRKGEKYEVHFTQDGRIRRRGQKGVLWSKTNLLDYTATSASPSPPVCLRNSVALKGLSPGEYEYDLILRDEVGKSAPATKTLEFTIIASPEPSTSEDRGEAARDRDR